MALTTDLLHGLLSTAHDALLAIDTNGRILFASDQVGRLFATPVANVTGQPIETLIPERNSTGHSPLRDAYSRQPSPTPLNAVFEQWGARGDGSEFPIEVSLRSMTREDGTTVVLAAVLDISDRIEIEAQRHRHLVQAELEQCQRLDGLGQLAGGVAHDFNNLLGVILNYTALLSRSVTSETDLADVNEIRNAAERGASLTRQLLAFARRDVTHPEVLDLRTVVNSAVAAMDGLFEDGIMLLVDLLEDPVPAVGDHHQLEQVLQNLLLNAAEAMPGGGTIAIAVANSLETEPARAQIRVSDGGGGMTPDVVARAFEPFFTTKPRGGGSGLGLSSVYGIVQQHGGDVRIVSEVGRGTEVTVTLSAAGNPAPNLMPDLEMVNGGNERILLVEDEESLRVGMARLLTDNGYRVQVAIDGIDALDVYRRDREDIDVVVTDVAMPRMRGDDLVRELRQLTPELKFVFMSGYNSGGDLTDAIPRGPLEDRRIGLLLSKPVSEDELLRAIRGELDA